MNDKAGSKTSVNEKGSKKKAMTKTSKQTNSTESSNKGPANQASNSKGSNLLAIISLLGLLLLAVALVYVVQQGKAELAQLKQDEQQQANVFADVQQSLSTLKENDNTQADAFSRLKSNQKTLEDSLNTLYEEKPNTNLDWTLMEVEYLVVIAMHRLLLERDVKTAIAALESADKRLVAVSNPALIPVREQITSDVNALKSVELVDITGLSLFLSDLITRVESLPVKKQTDLFESNVDVVEDSTETVSDWKDIPNQVWQELKSLVVIKHKDDEGAEFLLPEEEYYLYQNLRLQLESAKLAVLNLDNDNFRTSIDIIQTWLKRHFEIETTEVNNVMETLTKMKSVNLKPQIPEITSSLETVRAFIRNQEAKAN